MKRNYLLSLIAVCCVLAACSVQKTLYFEGKSDHWKVDYVIEVDADGQSEHGTIHMMYTGENSAPGRLVYKVEGASGNTSGDVPMENGTLEVPGSNCSGCAVTKKEDWFQVVMEWDGKTERFIMQNVK